MASSILRHRIARLALPALALAAAGYGGASLVAASPAASIVAAPTPAPARRPNFLFVLVDDLGARDLGFAGSRLHETPNLDAFARTGARFDAAYSPSPVCSPSRAAILTGKDPARLGITTWLPGGEYRNMPLIEPRLPNNMPLSETTIAEALKRGGYRTFYAGKWHLGGPGHLAADQGFDTSIGGGEYGQPPGGYYAPYRNRYLTDGPKGEYLEDRLADETIRFLNSANDGGKPFLAFLSMYTVHTPIQDPPGEASERFRDKARRTAQAGATSEREEGIGRTKLIQDNAAYAAMVHAMDRNFGRILAALDRLGLRDDTIVIFTSDNGGLSTLDPALGLYANGAPTANAPLRAGKGWTYEGGIRVPLLIGGPGIRPHAIASPVVLTDLHATLLDLARVRSAPTDSVSLKPLLDGRARVPERTLFWHFPHYHGSGSKPATAVRRGDWKLVRNYEPDDWELFDTRADPEERTNVSLRRPAQLAAMQREYRRMMAHTHAQPPIRRQGPPPGPSGLVPEPPRH